MKRKFHPPECANGETEKRGLCLAKNHKFAWFRKNVVWLPILHQKGNKQQVSAVRPGKYCFEKWKGDLRHAWARHIIPLPFNYNYYTKIVALYFIHSSLFNSPICGI